MDPHQIQKLDAWLVHLKKGIVLVLQGHLLTWGLLIVIIVILARR